MTRRSRNRHPNPLNSAQAHSEPEGPDFISRAAMSLSRESLVSRTLTFLLRFTGRAFDDHTGPLRQSPLGMFFYNQRALFFVFSGLFLAILVPFAIASEDAKKNIAVLLVLAGTWAFAGAVTLVLHKQFTVKLSHWQVVEPSSSFRRLFSPYFILDSASVLGLVAISAQAHLGLHFYSLLLFANLVVYSACVATWKGSGLAHIPPFLLWLVCMIVFVRSDFDAEHLPTAFHQLIDLGPQFGTTFVTIMAVLMISWLRQDEHRVTQRQLDFLGRAEDLLSSPLEAVGKEPSQAPMEREFQARIRTLLKALCSLGPPFWYGSACFWYIEDHQDRSKVLIPGPQYNMIESRLCQQPLAHSFGAIPCILSGPVESSSNFGAPSRLLPLTAIESVAFIPIVKGKFECGVLTLFGNDAPLGARATELVFLKTLGRIIADIMEQWDSRGRIGPQEEIDELFKCDALGEIFDKAAAIIQRHLYASCCALLFRADASASSLCVSASRGFKRDLGNLRFSSTIGPIGDCVTTATTRRCDDFDAHRGSIEDSQIASLEEQHRNKFSSWMLVPIGPKRRNFGAVLVANRKLKSPWFTDEDRLLAERLALRLQSLVEKFLHIESTEQAHKKAEEKAAEAEAARRIAELAARQRQDDLMVMTHQLQAPLYSVKFALQALIMERTARQIQTQLEHIEATIEDSLALCYGTVTTFAQAAGKKASFGASEIDAPEELEKLCRRLQLTNYRNDLRVEFKADPTFPKLYLDINVFTSVLYSLIQNAMKYAAKTSYITLECSFERGSGEAALKVKSFGEPILPEESDRIFERYQRGSVVSKTGRYHAGVGLGLWVARELMRAIGGNLTLELNREHPRLSIFIVHCPSQPVDLGASRPAEAV